MNNLISKILIWRIRNIKTKQFIMILSVLIGVIAGLAAILLKNGVHYFENLLRNAQSEDSLNWLLLVSPVMGILITVLFIRYFIKDDIGHGVSKVLMAISKWKGNIKSHNMYSSIVSCSITGGFGGSVGMEAPVLFTGAAIGSNVGQVFHLNYKIKTLLIGCGVAAAMSAIFKAPIAGFIFVLEVLMIEITANSIIPILIATVTGTLISSFLSGKNIEFYFALQDPVKFENIPFYILLGGFTAFISLYFTRMSGFVDRMLKPIKNIYFKALIGGLILSLLIFIFPPLFGEGYTTMRSILTGNAHELLNNTFLYEFSENDWIFVLFLILLLIFKVMATALTTSGGGIGGVFAPSLFMGAITGFVFAKIINLLGWFNISESNFTLVGMAGFLSGLMHAPLTAVFLIAEITGGYGLFIPLIITSTISYATIMYFEPHSLYTKKLALKGELITHHKDKVVLSMLKVSNVIETNFATVFPENSLGELVEKIAKSKRNIFPVLDRDNNFLGLVPLDDVREIMFDKDKYQDTFVKDLMVQSPELVSIDESLESVMKKFKESGLWNLPVLDNGKYKGFISRANVFNAYRKLLIEYTLD